MESFTDRDVARAAGPVHISGIDALRAFAMTAVVAEHSRIFTFGWAGVWVFYVISGFVVTGALSSRAHTSVLAGIRDFYFRRCARILPAYYAWVLIAIGVSLLLGNRPAWRAIGSLTFFYNNFAMAGGWGDLPGFSVGNLWTVSVEMQFYAIFGLLFLLATRQVTIGCLATLLIVCPVLRFVYGSALAANGVPALDAAYRVYSFSVLHFDAFAYGCLLSLFRNRLTPRLARAFAIAAGLALVAYLSVYAAANLRHGAHGLSICKNLVSGILFGQHREAFVYLPIEWAATSLLAVVLTSPRVNAALSAAPLLHVGRVSYGAYLYHGAMLTLAGLMLASLPNAGLLRFGVRGLQFLIAMAFVIGLASVSFRLLEQPVTRRVGRALSRSASGSGGAGALDRPFIAGSSTEPKATAASRE